MLADVYDIYDEILYPFYINILFQHAIDVYLLKICQYEHEITPTPHLHIRFLQTAHLPIICVQEIVGTKTIDRSTMNLTINHSDAG